METNKKIIKHGDYSCESCIMCNKKSMTHIVSNGEDY